MAEAQLGQVSLQGRGFPAPIVEVLASQRADGAAGAVVHRHRRIEPY